jgi:hypothetical protein
METRDDVFSRGEKTMMKFNIVAMGDGRFGIVSDANVFATQEEASAYVLKRCRDRSFGRRVQGEQANDALIANIAVRLAGALIKCARERGPEERKKVAELHTELCRVCREEMYVEEQGLPR